MSERGARTLMGVWGLCPQWGPGALPGGQGGEAPLKLTTIWCLMDTLNIVNCTIFSIIYAVNNATISVLFYKLVSRVASYAIFNIDVVTLLSRFNLSKPIVLPVYHTEFIDRSYIIAEL